jgi:hypothetical protein
MYRFQPHNIFAAFMTLRSLPDWIFYNRIEVQETIEKQNDPSLLEKVDSTSALNLTNSANEKK